MCSDFQNVVGVGNILMGDDGVGVAALAELARGRLPANVRLHDAGLAFSDVVGTLDPSEPLVVIDAMRAGGEPGSVYKSRLEDMEVEGASLAGALSLHELSVAPALLAEAVTGREFRDVTIFGVEPEVVEWGEGLSPAVSRALGPLADAILEHIDAARAAQARTGEP